MKKINKNKVYELIGRAVVFMAGYAGAIGLFVFGFLQNTIY